MMARYSIETQVQAFDLFRATYGIEARPEAMPEEWTHCLEIVRDELIEAGFEDA